MQKRNSHTLFTPGADPNVKDDEGDTPLHVLIRENGSSEAVGIFLKSVYANNVKLDLTIKNNERMSPLQLAKRLNRDAIVQLLIESGSQVSQRCITCDGEILFFHHA